MKIKTSALGNFLRQAPARAKRGFSVTETPATGSSRTKTCDEQRSNLEMLLDDSMRGNAAAHSTMDALMYSLRSGTAALSREDVRHRLAALDEKQMRDVCTLLQKRNPNVAKSWTSDEIECFVTARAARHA
jgi:conjugal transfer/entry exclusion protein